MYEMLAALEKDLCGFTYSQNSGTGAYRIGFLDLYKSLFRQQVTAQIIKQNEQTI